MNDFEYAAAHTIDEAVSLLAARGDRAKILAGGTDILVQLREGLRDADLVLDVKKIPELTAVRFDSQSGLVLGAAVPAHRMYEDGEIAQRYAALADAARIIGGWQIQSRASIGGNLCNSSPAADSIPALICLGAVCQIVGPGGRRELPVAEFCTGPGRNALQRGELLVSILLPAPKPNSGSSYQRFIPRNEMDIAVVGVGAQIELDKVSNSVAAARIALGAVGPTPLVASDAAAWLVGQPATDDSFREAGRRAQEIARPISDMRGPAEYRRHLVGVLVARNLARATQRALGKS